MVLYMWTIEVHVKVSFAMALDWLIATVCTTVPIGNQVTKWSPAPIGELSVPISPYMSKKSSTQLPAYGAGPVECRSTNVPLYNVNYTLLIIDDGYHCLHCKICTVVPPMCVMTIISNGVDHFEVRLQMNTTECRPILIPPTLCSPYAQG